MTSIRIEEIGHRIPRESFIDHISHAQKGYTTRDILESCKPELDLLFLSIDNTQDSIARCQEEINKYKQERHSFNEMIKEKGGSWVDKVGPLLKSILTWISGVFCKSEKI